MRSKEIRIPSDIRVPQSGIELSKVQRPTKHIIGHIGDGFYGSKDPTNSVIALKEETPKDWASIPLDPPHCADNTTTYMQYEKQKHNTQINTTKSRLCTVKCTQCDKTQSSLELGLKLRIRCGRVQCDELATVVGQLSTTLRDVPWRIFFDSV